MVRARPEKAPFSELCSCISSTRCHSWASVRSHRESLRGLRGSGINPTPRSTSPFPSLRPRLRPGVLFYTSTSTCTRTLHRTVAVPDNAIQFHEGPAEKHADPPPSCHKPRIRSLPTPARRGWRFPCHRPTSVLLDLALSSTASTWTMEMRRPRTSGPSGSSPPGVWFR